MRADVVICHESVARLPLGPFAEGRYGVLRGRFSSHLRVGTSSATSGDWRWSLTRRFPSGAKVEVRHCSSTEIAPALERRAPRCPAFKGPAGKARTLRRFLPSGGDSDQSEVVQRPQTPLSDRCAINGQIGGRRMQ